MKHAVMICPITDREKFLEGFMGTFPYSGEDLLVVDSIQKPCSLDEWDFGPFENVIHIRIDEAKSHYPIAKNSVSLKVNIGARYLNEKGYDAFFYTHLECHFQDEVGGGCPKPEDIALFIPTHKAMENGGWEDKTGPHKPGSWWWYAVWIPVGGFCEVRGFDERLLIGGSGEDDQFAYCWQNSGRQWGFLDYRPVLHQWHPPITNGIEDGMRQNWDIGNEYRHDTSRVVSNPDGYEWGSKSVISQVRNYEAQSRYCYS